MLRLAVATDQIVVETAARAMAAGCSGRHSVVAGVVNLTEMFGSNG